jgi:hypothetical protein
MAALLTLARVVKVTTVAPTLVSLRVHHNLLA